MARAQPAPADVSRVLAHSSPMTPITPLGVATSDQLTRAGADCDGVLRLWLSSVRPLYRATVRGRRGGGHE